METGKNGSGKDESRERRTSANKQLSSNMKPRPSGSSRPLHALHLHQNRETIYISSLDHRRSRQVDNERQSVEV
ncbi:hypothetical protein EYF80_028861 [Liparis tanakae]|uniref:Uncharacterized protein n=1 Tax=Liparis tanakae TaxID=230148 RepID=A0A4Z2H584_9TELE|nr:hypothetical protein EYF80_028861 [Liparis tanakae]